MVVGYAVNRPVLLVAWLILIASQVLSVAGDMTSQVLIHFRPGQVTPSLADVFYLSNYVLM